jgi:hypothetical protein
VKRPEVRRGIHSCSTQAGCPPVVSVIASRRDYLATISMRLGTSKILSRSYSGQHAVRLLAREMMRFAAVLISIAIAVCAVHGTRSTKESRVIFDTAG